MSNWENEHIEDSGSEDDVLTIGVDALIEDCIYENMTSSEIPPDDALPDTSGNDADMSPSIETTPETVDEEEETHEETPVSTGLSTRELELINQNLETPQEDDSYTDEQAEEDNAALLNYMNSLGRD